MSAASRTWAVLALVAALVTLASAGYEFSRTCSTDKQCSNIAFSFCNEAGRCECSESYSQLNETACGRIIGDRCFDGVCHANNSRCDSSACVCKFGFGVNHNGTFCFKAPQHYGDLCNITADCPDFGQGRECKHGRCVCQDAFAFDFQASTCKFKIDEIDKQCQKDNQICYLERDGDNQKVQCIDGTCQCRYKLSKDKLSCSGAASLLASAGVAVLALLARAAA